MIMPLILIMSRQEMEWLSMGKLIVVCGSPNSGKTVTSLKLAQEIYTENKKNVMFVSPDLRVPTLSYLFPNGKDNELYSLGVALDKTDVLEEDVLKQTVTTKNIANLGHLAFKLGENKFSYPRPTEDKVVQLLSVLRGVADYTVVDCTCDADDIISSIAMRDCDIAVQLFNPDMRCISYYASCFERFLLIQDKLIKVLNTIENDVYSPVCEVAAHFKGTDLKLPYERVLRWQTITGTLSEKIRAGKYKKELGRLTKAVL